MMFMIPPIIAHKLKIDHKAVLNHLNKAIFKKKLNIWVSEQLPQKNLMNRTSIFEASTKQNEIEPFLKKIVTGDEKWVIYNIV